MYDFPANPVEGQQFKPPVGGQTYIWESPRWLVEGIPPALLAEAPEDGQQYGRQSGSWSVITHPSTTWANIPGKPATFPPTLPIPQSGVTNLTADMAKIVPPGTVIMYAKSTAPAGYLKANGAVLSRGTYAALFAAIGTTFGAGDGSTTFGIPDLRGEFQRGWDDARGADASRAFGSAQTHGMASHTHTWSATSAGHSATHTHLVSGNSGNNNASHQHAVSITSAGHSANHTHTVSGTSGNANASHTHSFSDSSSASGTGSANHSHTTSSYYSPGSQGELDPGAKIFGSQDGSVLFSPATNSTGASHTHTTAVSGTTGGHSVTHAHSFSATSAAANVTHTHGVTGNTGSQNTNHLHAVSITSAGASVTHTHTVSGTTAANLSPTPDTRPRNVALLACIKY